ncbi:MAG: FAD-dependent oxidoreductase [Deltaproteobacteria bacterium]|nr:FAD-dependent oxidoreductase [Deltaproteobacteria bacterium]
MAFDAIIVGAGLTGAAIARDCARRGLRVLLCEARDIGSGSTAVETGLLDIGVSSDRERRRIAEAELELLQRIAGPLLTRLPLLWPLSATAAIGTRLRQRAQIARAQLPRAARLGGYRIALTPPELRAIEPALAAAASSGAVLTHAWWTDVPHLAALLVGDAIEAGAELRTHARVSALLRDESAVVGVTLVDDRGESIGSHAAPLVLNCAGAGSDDLAALAYGAVALTPIRCTLVRLARRCTGAAIALGGPSAGLRLVPVSHASVLGGWREPGPGGGDTRPRSPSVVERMLAIAARAVEGLAAEPVLEVASAVQARAADDPPQEGVPRRFRLIDHRAQGVGGLFTIIGGAALEHRWIAEQVTDALCRLLGRGGRCVTGERALLGGDAAIDSGRLAAQFQIAADVADRLVARYGWRAHSALRSNEPGAGLALVCRCQGISGAELMHALRHEAPRTLSDLCRRTGLGSGPCGGQRCLREAARIAREAHCWSASELLSELLAAKQERLESARRALPRLPLAALALDQMAHRLSANLDRFWRADRARRGRA